MPLPPPDRPPSAAPPVLWAASSEAGLPLTADGSGTLGGLTFSPTPFRDVVLDAVLELESGGEEAACGLFFRQAAERDYLTFCVTSAGRAAVIAVEDGTPRTLADGPIPADAPFAPGPQGANRLTVIAAGPSITCLVNGFVLVGVIVEPRFRTGLAGALVLPGQPGVAASARVRWAQVRALLPDQD